MHKPIAMKNQFKVGQTFDVAVITDNSAYPSLYDNGNTGIITNEDEFSACICVGSTGSILGVWSVWTECYKKIGKLTITKVK